MLGKNKYRILVVGATEALCEQITGLLPKNDYEPLIRAGSVGAARRLAAQERVDLAVLNGPFKEEVGSQLALDLAADNVCVLLLTPAEIFDQISYQVEDEGVLTLAKPMSRQSFYSAVKLLTAMRGKLLKMEQKNKALRDKMEDIRLVNRAKWVLIRTCGMTEEDAHYYIEKAAMDRRCARGQVAQEILRSAGE